jgi:hypothetical protein
MKIRSHATNKMHITGTCLFFILFALFPNITNADEGTIVFQPEEGPKIDPIAMADIKTLSPPKPPPKWQFDGRISLGVSYE